MTLEFSELITRAIADKYYYYVIIIIIIIINDLFQFGL